MCWMIQYKPEGSEDEGRCFTYFDYITNRHLERTASGGRSLFDPRRIKDVFLLNGNTATQRCSGMIACEQRNF